MRINVFEKNNYGKVNDLTYLQVVQSDVIKGAAGAD